MRYLLKFIATLVAAVWMTSSAIAGALVDGIAAYNRGDYDRAVELLRPLAEQGHAKAQNQLGTMICYGQGVPKDKVQAFYWFNLAAALEDKVGLLFKPIVAAQLTPTELA